MSITKEDIASVKARGFLRNRGTECFSGRVVVAGGVYTARDLAAIAECAEKYGNGKVMKHLDFPEHMSPNALLQALNLLYDLERLEQLLIEL